MYIMLTSLGTSCGTNDDDDDDDDDDGGDGGVVPAERCFVRIESAVQKRPFSLGPAARTEQRAHTDGPAIGDLVRAAPRPLPGARTGTEQRMDAEGHLVTSVRRPFSLRP